MELLGVGIPELGLVMLIALVIVGPQRFPEIARQMARWIRTARAFTDEVMKDVRSAVDEIEQDVTAANDGVNPIRELREIRNELAGAAQDATATVEEARTLPPVTPINDEWAAVAETTATESLEGPDVPASVPDLHIESTTESTPPEPWTAPPTAEEPTPSRRADA